MGKNNKLISSRKQKGLSQKELSELVGCSQSMISKVESGSRTPNDDIKINLSKILNKSIEWMFFSK